MDSRLTRTCICKNSVRCRQLTNQLHEYAEHRGHYVRLPETNATYQTPRAIKCRALWTRSFHRLGRGEVLLGTGLSENTGSYVSHIHFPEDLTLGVNGTAANFMIDGAITQQQKQLWGIDATAEDKSPDPKDDGAYLVLPYRSIRDAEDELSRRQREAAQAVPDLNPSIASRPGSTSSSAASSASSSSAPRSAAAPAATQRSPATAAAQSLAQSNEEVRSLKRERDQKDERIRDLEEAVEDKERQCREYRAEVAKLNELVSNLQKQVSVLEEALAETKDEHNREVLQAEIDDVKLGQHLLSSGGLCRANLTSATWHAENPKAANHLFGFSSWTEAKNYIWAFWPDMDQRPARSNESDMTDFEKCLITKMRFRRGYEEDTLAFIWGRHQSRINRYVGQWAPKWGEMGRVLSELHMDEKYLLATEPAAYKALLLKVGALDDGKDFETETERKNSAVKTAQYSNKVDHSAFRVIVWSTPSGLVFEKTCAFLGRPSEGRLVRLWRERLGKIPAGWAVLADRGFANDARAYPNVNPHLTPHFLRPKERTQFETTEVSTDHEKSMLRYTSETVFSRVTDEKILTDVVPYSAFSIFQHAYDWACGKANLCKRFTHPEVDRRLALRAAAAAAAAPAPARAPAAGAGGGGDGGGGD